MIGKFSYDDFGDNLIISIKKSNEKVNQSFMFDNLVLSMTSSGKIVGLEIQGISNFLKESGINPSILNLVNAISLDIIYKRDLLLIKFTIKCKNKEQIVPVTRLPLQALPCQLS